MFEALRKLEAAQYVSPEEVSIALAAEEAGTTDHTVGYELEIKKEAVGSVPMLGESTPERVEFQQYGEILECQSMLTRLGFGAVNEDGLLYEIVSPPAQHSLPLDIATRGLVRAGVLPANAKNNVTAHISIGTGNRFDSKADKSRYCMRFVNMLRAVELVGGSTSDRLVEDPENGFFSDTGWNSRGILGVHISANPSKKRDDKENLWQGDNSRIELRSLSYQNPDQFGQTLESIYFMSRALLEFGTEAAETYNQFDNWFSEYQADNGLKNMNKAVVLNMALDRSILDAYIESQAAHIAAADLSEVRKKVADTVDELKQEFGMPDADLDELMAA